MDKHTEDRNIEDYLFGDYLLNSKSTFERDQNFAKPIEDEDLFGFNGVQWGQDGCDNQIVPTDGQMELDVEIPDLGGDIYKDLSGASPNGSVLDDNLEIMDGPTSDLSHKPASELDEIFRDDYSESSQDNHTALTNNENTYPGASKKKLPPPPPTPAQIKKKLFKEKVLEQARTKNRAPQKPGADLKQDGVIEVEIMHDSLVSTQNSKFIFNRLFNKSKKASPESEKKCWATYKDNLRKKICTQKRKVWDSFQCRIVVDDEDEFIEPEVPKDKPELDGLSDTGDDTEDKLSAMADHIDDGDDKSDGNFEDLEREDMGSNASQSSDGDEDKELAEDKGNKSDLEFELNGLDSEKDSVDDEEEALEDEPREDAGMDNDYDDESNHNENSEDDDNDDDLSMSKKSDNDYSLNLDDSSNETQVEKRKRRAILIDDEASEED